MQWLIDLLWEKLLANIQAFLDAVWSDICDHGIYRFRGDPGWPDFDQDDLTLDGAWHELDLSSIVEPCTKAADVHIYMYTTPAPAWLMFRRPDQVNYANLAFAWTTIPDVYHSFDLTLPLDTNGKTKYACIPGQTYILQFVVKGWWL